MPVEAPMPSDALLDGLGVPLVVTEMMLPLASVTVVVVVPSEFWTVVVVVVVVVESDGPPEETEGS